MPFSTAVIHGFATHDCSGTKTSLKSWASQSVSDPPIQSYKWGSDETCIDEIECKKVLGMEILTVLVFHRCKLELRKEWSVRYAESSIEESEQCLLSKIEKPKYDLVVGDPMGKRYGGFYSYDPPTIHVDVLEILFLYRKSIVSSLAYPIQVILHEMILAAVENGIEEAFVWKLTVGAYTAFFGNKLKTLTTALIGLALAVVVLFVFILQVSDDEETRLVEDDLPLYTEQRNIQQQSEQVTLTDDSIAQVSVFPDTSRFVLIED